MPMRAVISSRTLAGGAFVLLLLTATPILSQTQPVVIYGGNADFAPFEYLDEKGNARGIAVDLLNGVSQLAGVRIEMRLKPFSETVRDLREGRVGLASMARTPEREKEFDFLGKLWTHRYVVGYQQRRGRKPDPSDLSAETIAVQAGAIMHEVLGAMPAAVRPRLILVSGPAAAMEMLRTGEATAVASSELALGRASKAAHLKLEYVLIQALPFHFATRKGNARSFEWLGPAMVRASRTGLLEQALEKMVQEAGPPVWHSHLFSILGAALILALVAVLLVLRNRARSLRESEVRYRLLAESERHLHHQVLHDSLTQLPNRRRFLEQVGIAVNTPGGACAVLLLDVDRFKLVNESLGHVAGDRLLLHIGGRLQKLAGSGVLLSRYGGDEFAFLMHGASRAEALALASVIHAGMEPAVMLNEQPVFATGSIGIAFSSAGEDAPALLRNAELALNRAKLLGRGLTVEYYEGLRSQVVSPLHVEGDLRLAGERGQLALEFQPIISLATQAIAGYEALLRWKHPSRGILLPGDFLPHPQDGGLMQRIDEWVIGETLRHVAAMPEDPAGWRVSINVSGHSLRLPDFAAKLQRLLHERGVPPRRIAIEITEQVLVEEAQSISVLEELHALGIELYLDDFGTGFSSLSYLATFPIARLKIDRSFVLRLAEGAKDLTVVKGIIALAEGLNIGVVAEGVENEEQARILRQLGCPMAQGFYFGKSFTALAAANTRQ